ncbi:uncharacterized protein LOC133870288 [Alnus glutinosa]|uniref:uncharacterized protein LOC133870288 n=1 Tax=Alnus glutinosa TaxID=3517 RepID=UPI002D79B89A|nr:uncharacterized protein LOC133870288 [Alnus glutinosa]
MKWTEEHELTLVYELLDLATQGVRQSFKGHFANITANLNKRIVGDGVQYSQDQVSKKIGKLRENWKNFTDLLTGHVATGAGWNEVDNTVALDERQWEQLKTQYGTKKFYKFRKGAPANYSLLNNIFGGTTATGRYRHASTRSPPESSDSDEVACVDLNLTPAIIDLTEPQQPPPRTHKKKGKRVASPTNQSPHSSKRSSKGEAVMHDLNQEFYKIADHIERTLIKTETVGSVGNAGCSTGRGRDWLLDAVAIIKTLAVEFGLNAHQQRKACEAMSVNNYAKLFVAMEDACQRDWMMSFVRGDDD